MQVVMEWELSAKGSGAVFVCDKTPALAGREGAIHISPATGFNATVKFEYSNDGGTTWTDYLTAAKRATLTGGRSAVFALVLGGRVRATLDPWTSGKVNYALMAGP